MRTRDTNIIEQRKITEKVKGEEAKKRKDESDIIGSTDEEDLRASAHRFTTPGGVPPHHGSPAGVVGVEMAVVGVTFYHFLKRIRGLCCPHHAPP